MHKCIYVHREKNTHTFLLWTYFLFLFLLIQVSHVPFWLEASILGLRLRLRARLEEPVASSERHDDVARFITNP